MLALTLLLFPQTISCDWNETPIQYWIGQEWHANRLQDWKVENNRVMCAEAGERLPMRTLHLLNADISGNFKASVTMGPIDPRKSPGEHDWSGFHLH